MAELIFGLVIRALLAGLIALAGMVHKAWKDADSPAAAVLVGGSVGCFVSVLICLGDVYFLTPIEYIESGLSFRPIIGFCVGGGVIAGGVSAGIWEQIDNRLGIVPVGQGAIGGGIGAIGGLFIVLVVAGSMLGG